MIDLGEKAMIALYHSGVFTNTHSKHQLLVRDIDISLPSNPVAFPVSNHDLHDLE